MPTTSCLVKRNEYSVKGDEGDEYKPSSSRNRSGTTVFV